MVSLREDSEQEDICPICQEDLKKAVITDCRHQFCQTCLAQHLEKASHSGFFCCPVCREPCSEGVLGMGYICLTHQKRVRSFCEESRLLLCEECEKSPEHKSHRELTIEEGINHYKERLFRKIRKVKKVLGDLTKEHPQSSAQEEEKQQAVQFQVDCGTHRLEAELDNQHQARRPPDVFSQQWPDQPEDVPTEAPSSLKAHLCSLLTDLDWMVKKLDASKLKDASDLLDRNASLLKTICPKSEK